MRNSSSRLLQFQCSFPGEQERTAQLSQPSRSCAGILWNSKVLAPTGPSAVMVAAWEADQQIADAFFCFSFAGILPFSNKSINV